MAKAKLLISELESLTQKAKQLVERQEREESWGRMLPRRREIWQVISEHPEASFDFIARRFPGVNPKTLHYDLGRLQKQGWIRKLGVSRGAVYSVIG